MALDINGYNTAFRGFVNFAMQAADADNGKLVVDAQVRKTNGRNVLVLDKAKNDSVRNMFRGNDQWIVNDRTRNLFKSAVIDMFGGSESRIPASVKKAMAMSDYGDGKPLTARRIIAVKNAIDAFKQKDFVDKLPESMTIAAGGGTFKFEKWHYKRMVEAMPPAERPKTLAELKTFIAGRVENGRAILRDVMAGRGAEHEATVKNVADITIALHAVSSRNGDIMPDGAFSVADPDGRLAKWLDTSRDVYVRSSTHIETYQQMNVDGHLNMPRGIDIPEGRNGLMAGMRTVHYGTIPDLDHLDDKGGSGPKRRLFLKCESFGAYHNTIKDKDAAASLSKGMRIREARDGDWPESIRHTFSFLATRGADATKGGARKEHLSSHMKAAMEVVAKMLKKDGCKAAAEMLLEGNPAAGGGVRMLNRNIARLLDSGLLTTSKAWEDVKYLLREMNAEINGKYGPGNNRLGNEVMIEVADIA